MSYKGVKGDNPEKSLLVQLQHLRYTIKEFVKSSELVLDLIKSYEVQESDFVELMSDAADEIIGGMEYIKEEVVDQVISELSDYQEENLTMV